MLNIISSEAVRRYLERSIFLDIQAGLVSSLQIIWGAESGAFGDSTKGKD